MRTHMRMHARTPSRRAQQVHCLPLTGRLLAAAPSALSPTPAQLRSYPELLHSYMEVFCDAARVSLLLEAVPRRQAAQARRHCVCLASHHDRSRPQCALNRGCPQAVSSSLSYGNRHALLTTMDEGQHSEGLHPSMHCCNSVWVWMCGWGGGLGGRGRHASAGWGGGAGFQLAPVHVGRMQSSTPPMAKP